LDKHLRIKEKSQMTNDEWFDMTRGKHKPKPAPTKEQPPIVIEYHYTDGDVGAHEALDYEAKLFQGFSADHEPSHIVLRIENERGQQLSNVLFEASKHFSRNTKPATDLEALTAIARLDRIALQAIADMKIDDDTDFQKLLGLCMAVATIQIKKGGRV